MFVLISFPDILRMPHTGDMHPFKIKLNLVVRAVSGNNLLIKDFHMRLLMSSLPRGDQEILDSMNFAGIDWIISQFLVQFRAVKILIYTCYLILVHLLKIHWPPPLTGHRYLYNGTFTAYTRRQCHF